MNHERRIKQLEKELEQLKQRLQASGLLDEFVPLSEAARQLNLKTWVIRSRIKSDRISVELGKHYQLNGTRYLVNVAQWRKLIAADAKAKHQ